MSGWHEEPLGFGFPDSLRFYSGKTLLPGFAADFIDDFVPSTRTICIDVGQAHTPVSGPRKNHPEEPGNGAPISRWFTIAAALTHHFAGVCPAPEAAIAGAGLWAAAGAALPGMAAAEPASGAGATGTVVAAGLSSTLPVLAGRALPK